MHKKCLFESEIRDKFIRPTIEVADWDRMSKTCRGYPLRVDRVVVRGCKVCREASTVLRADCAFLHKRNIPLAVVEAKDDNHTIIAEMGEAISYTKPLGVPFSVSSNVDGFLSRDATLADGVLECNPAGGRSSYVVCAVHVSESPEYTKRAVKDCRHPRTCS